MGKFVSYFNKIYEPFIGSLPDIIAVKRGIKPLTRLNCDNSVEKCLNFLKFSQKNKLYFEIKKSKLATNAYLSKRKNLVDFYKLYDPEYDFNSATKSMIKSFAKSLGYPSCCIKNYLDKSQKQIVTSYLRDGVNTIPFYFNNFLHSISNYYLSFHLSCSLNCKLTKAYNQKIFNAIRKDEPEFAIKLKEILTYPTLVWFNMNNQYCYDDRIVILFQGFIVNKTIHYSRCFFLKTNYPNNKAFHLNVFQYLPYFKVGDKLEYSRKEINIFKNNNLIYKIKRQSNFEGALFKFY